jgi:hypothetical protein
LLWQAISSFQPGANTIWYAWPLGHLIVATPILGELHHEYRFKAAA